MRSKEEMLQSMEMVNFLFKCRVDFKFFCERVLGLNEQGGIHSFQLEWFHLAQNHDRVVIRAPSGFSKTTILGVAYPLWLIWNYKNLKILLISKTVTQSKENLLMQIRYYIENNDLLKELIPKDYKATWNTQLIKTTNGCQVMNRPYSVNIKGVRADIILLDEAASYENTEIYFDYVVPRLNPGGKIIIISTPESPTDLMCLIESTNKGEYLIRNYPAIINLKSKGDYASGESIWPERFPVEELLRRREEIGEYPFQKNYMCNSKAESEDSIFSFRSIMACFDIDRKLTFELEDGKTFIGCDFAISRGKRADYDAFVVIEKKDNFFIIRHIEIHRGVKTPVKVSRIQDLVEIYKPVRLIADESNIGAAVIDEMRARGMTVKSQSFHSAARKELLVTLKNVIDGQMLVIPRSLIDTKTIKLTELLVEQLLGFKEKTNEQTKHKQIISSSAHDDIVMALAMAIKEATKQKGATVFAATGS